MADAEVRGVTPGNRAPLPEPLQRREKYVSHQIGKSAIGLALTSGWAPGANSEFCFVAFAGGLGTEVRFAHSHAVILREIFCHRYFNK